MFNIAGAIFWQSLVFHLPTRFAVYDGMYALPTLK